MEVREETPLSSRARDSLASFLTEYSWDAFITATTSRPVYHPRQALSLVSQRLAVGPFGRAFLAAERFYLGGYHVHGLCAWRKDETGQVDGFAACRAMARLERLGWSRVGGLRDIGNAAGYVAKYLTKTSEVEYDFYGDVGWIALEQ